MTDGSAESTMLLIVVAAALMDGDGRVLVQRRPAGRAMAGLWEFPGGKLEPGETPEAALRRELMEELGIAAGALTPIGFASEPLAARHLLLLLFTCSEWSGRPAALDADELRWVSAEELTLLEMPPADRPLVAELVRPPIRPADATS